MSEKLGLHQAVITTNPILVYLDPDKQYYLLTDSNQHSLELHPGTAYRAGKGRWHQTEGTPLTNTKVEPFKDCKRTGVF